MASIRDNELVMMESCKCECGKSEKILRHFEKCEVCSSEGYHITIRFSKKTENKKEKNKNGKT